MFYHLKGVIAEILPGMAVVECGGAGYAVYTTQQTLSRLRVGAEAKLYIREIIREDAFDLYGFATLAEKNCFELLTAVSGVGPKAAVSILSSGTPDSVYMAVMSGDDRALTAAPGIGKKLAQRVILELKDKLGKMNDVFPAGEAAVSVPAGDPARAKISDAAAALTSLGYSSAEAAAALRGVDMSLPLEEIIRAALRGMIT